MWCSLLRLKAEDVQNYYRNANIDQWIPTQQMDIQVQHTPPKKQSKKQPNPKLSQCCEFLCAKSLHKSSRALTKIKSSISFVCWDLGAGWLGIPQGSILGPLLFILYTILSLSSAIFYAEDTISYATVSSLDLTIANLQLASDKF